MYLETMQQVFSNTAKVYTDTKAGGNMLYLPLDKLMQQSGGDASVTRALPAAAAPATTVEPVAPAAAQDPSTRAREGLRTRERP
jgi:modulator of FtsH protease HflK